MQAEMTNSNSLTCDDCSDLLDEFALGDLPQSISAQISQHLSQGCETCNQRLAQVVADLSLAAHAAQSRLPSLRIERELMQRIATRSSDSETPAASRQLKLINKPPSSRVFAITIALAALLIGVAAWSTWNRAIPGDSADPSREATDYQASLQRRINRANETQPFSAVPQLKFAYLRRPAPEKLVNGYIAIDEAARQWHLYLFNLPPLADELKYQAWLVVDGVRYIRASAIEVDVEGTASLVLDLPPNVSTVSGIAISDEPTTDSDEPTGENFFRADIP